MQTHPAPGQFRQRQDHPCPYAPAQAGPGHAGDLSGRDPIRRDMLWAKDTKDGPAVPLLINLVQYGRQHCEYVILEGILFPETYEELFRCIQAEYSAEDIHAYYYDIPFEETLRRHETKPNRADFGPEAMRDWWKEKDYIGYLPEKILTQTMTLEDAGARILADVQAR